MRPACPQKLQARVTPQGLIENPGQRLKLCILQITAPNPEDGLVGLIERFTFQNEETRVAVLRVKVKGRRELAIVVGSLASVSAGEWISAQGRWVLKSNTGCKYEQHSLNALRLPR